MMSVPAIRAPFAHEPDVEMSAPHARARCATDARAVVEPVARAPDIDLPGARPLRARALDIEIPVVGLSCADVDMPARARALDIDISVARPSRADNHARHAS